jgi:peptidoglycan/LPS O-acetylase OafA/YrhL
VYGNIVAMESLPQFVIDALRALENLWSLALLIAVVVTLSWFLYRVFLRKFIRARRIANLRLARLMRERRDNP